MVDRATMTGKVRYSAPAVGIALASGYLYWTSASGLVLRAPK